VSDLFVVRSLTADDIRRMREPKKGVERGSYTAAPSRPTQDGEIPRFSPARPDAVFRRMMDQLQGWARADKEAWRTSIAMFRRANPTAAAHMTDEQLYDMLKDKIERSIKQAYTNMGRDKELKIRIGGL